MLLLSSILYEGFLSSSPARSRYLKNVWTIHHSPLAKKQIKFSEVYKNASVLFFLWWITLSRYTMFGWNTPGGKLVLNLDIWQTVIYCLNLKKEIKFVFPTLNISGENKFYQCDELQEGVIKKYEEQWNSLVLLMDANENNYE
jgi:hypothetical protein